MARKTVEVPRQKVQKKRLPLASSILKPKTFGHQKMTAAKAAKTIRRTMQWKCAMTNTLLWTV